MSNEEEEEEEAPRCPVCLDDIGPGNMCTMRLGCGHCFHSNCFLEWAVRDNLSCPQCRRTVIDGTRPLYRPGLHDRTVQLLTRLESLLRLLIMCCIAAVSACSVFITATLVTAIKVATSLSVVFLASVLLLWLCVVVASWFFRLSLTGGSRLCTHTRAIFPLVEFHASGLIQLFADRAARADPLTLLVYTSVRACGVVALETLRLLLQSDVLCGLG